MSSALLENTFPLLLLLTLRILTCENLALNQEVKMLVTQSCPTVCHLVDCSLPGSSVHGILQARILEWVSIPSLENGISPTQHQTPVSHIAGRIFTIWAPGENPKPERKASLARMENKWKCVRLSVFLDHHCKEHPLYCHAVALPTSLWLDWGLNQSLPSPLLLSPQVTPPAPHPENFSIWSLKTSPFFCNFIKT